VIRTPTQVVADIDGLIVWGATRRTSPNTSPWQHLSDLDALTEQLGARLG
jgi:hypothetical protein